LNEETETLKKTILGRNPNTHMNIFMKNSMHSQRISQRFLSSAIVATLLWSIAGTSLAASIWNPTLLVNTESFNTIDDGDGTTPIQMRFGDTLGETITFNRTALWRFEFSQSVYVKGNITATGSLSIKGAMSGSSLHVDNAVDVNGGISGSGTLRIEGAAAFGNTIRLNNVTYTFPFGDGISSGMVLKTNAAGQLSWSTDLNTNAQTICATGQYLDGDGNCVDVIEETEMDSMSELETQVGSVNILTSGELDSLLELQTLIGDISLLNQTNADNRYVNQSGDTMTGALQIRPTTAGQAALEVAGTASGRVLSFSERLTGSGNVFIRTLIDSVTAFQVLDNDGGNPVFNIDTTNERVGIGTAAPETALEVIGTISGSTIAASNSLTSSGTLAVEGNAAFGGTIKLNGVAYTFPGGAGNNGQVLTTSGNGTLTWSEPSVGIGSGGVLFLSPEYPNAVYVGSGSSYIGQLSAAYDATNKENYYHWITSKTTPLQEYTIAVRVRVPDNFSAWDANQPVQLRYRTGTADNTENLVSIRMQDTAGAWVPLTGNENLAAASWTTANITGPQTEGHTFTPTGYITLFIKLATKSTGSADAGFINLNWETSAP